jgi:hypothetical protein
MGQRIGCKKPAGSGRSKGTPNKRTTFNSVSSRLEELGYDLVGEILQDLALISNPYDRAKLHLQLLEYCDARRKAIELPGTQLGEAVAVPQVIFTIEGESK